jgi:hypothetical protein
MDFFHGGEATSLRLNMSLGISGFVHIFLIDGIDLWVKVMLQSNMLVFSLLRTTPW